MDPAIRLLRELVAINSVNPSLVPDAPGEREIAEVVATHLRQLGMDVEMQEVAPGRANVVGMRAGRNSGRSLMFCGHIDTVGVAGMSAPFDPVVRSGRVYGRGAQDMKGGVAAMIDAVRLITSDPDPTGTLIVAAVVDEEFASAGADALVSRWRADGAIVTEPTDLQIGIGHKGFAWFEVETKGVAAHGSRPLDGRDAIFRMGRVLNALEALDRDLQRRPPHPLMGTASLHASLIEGGREWSSYPDRCSLKLERRTIAGETGASVDGELAEILDGLKDADLEFEASHRRIFARPHYEISSQHPLPRALAGAVGRAIDVEPRLSGMSFWTDAAILGQAGTPAVLFGPGGEGLHGTEEYVRIDEVVACRDALAAFARDWLAEK